jgi:hypothetical protein
MISPACTSATIQSCAFDIFVDEDGDPMDGSEPVEV